MGNNNETINIFQNPQVKIELKREFFRTFTSRNVDCHIYFNKLRDQSFDHLKSIQSSESFISYLDGQLECKFMRKRLNLALT